MSKSYSLKIKLAIPIMLITFFVLVILTSFIAIQSWRGAKDSAQEHSVAMSQAYAADIKTNLLKYYTISKNTGDVLKSLKAQGQTKRDVSITIFKDIMTQNPELIGLWSIWEPNEWDNQDRLFINSKQYDETGRFVIYVNFKNNKAFLDKLIDYEVPGEGDYYLIPKKRQQDTLMDPFLYRIRNENVMMTSIVTPLFIDKKFVGVSGVDISLENIQKTINQIKPYDESHAYLISHNGAYLSHPDESKISKQAFVGSKHENIRTLLHSKESFSIIARDDLGEEQLFTATAISLETTNQTWYLLVKTPTSTILAGAKKFLVKQISVAFLGLLLIFVAIILLANFITSKLNTIVSNLKKESSLVSASSRKVNGSALTILESANHQAASLQETASAIEEISAMVARNAENAARSVEISERTARSALIGMKIAQNLIHTTQGIPDSDKGLITAKECAKALEDILENVSNVNEMIKDISSASAEQSQGILEINSAMSEIEQTTHVSTSNASRASETAKELMNQAIRLDLLVAELNHLSHGDKTNQ